MGWLFMVKISQPPTPMLYHLTVEMNLYTINLTHTVPHCPALSPTATVLLQFDLVCSVLVRCVSELMRCVPWRCGVCQGKTASDNEFHLHYSVDI